MKLKISLLLFLLLLITVWGLNINQAAAEFNYQPGVEGIKTSGSYIFWELEEFNDLLEDNNDFIRDYVALTRESLFAEQDIEYEVTTHRQEDKTAAKIEQGLGYRAGIQLSPVAHRLLDFDIYPHIKYERNFTSRRAEAEFASTGKMTEYEDEELEQFIPYELEGSTNTELELSLRGITLPLLIPVFETIDLVFTPLYFWGDGEIVHNDDAEFTYTDGEDIPDELEEFLQEVAGEHSLETEELFDISSSLGWKLGAEYAYQLTETLSLFARGSFRSLKMDIDVHNREYEYGDRNQKDIFGLLERSIYGELQDVSEDFGGTEISVGFSIVF